MQRLLDYADGAGSRAMFHVSTKGTSLTPAAIARGEGDRFLLAMNRMLGEHGQPTYLRLLSEMNNGNNPYAAYDLSGRSRGTASSTRAFKRAWRRAVLVIRGGDVAADRRAARPAAACRRCAPATSELRPAAGGVHVGAAHPTAIPRSRATTRATGGPGRATWTGSAPPGTRPTWPCSAIDRFYRNRLWRKKPFAFGEYGVWGAESPRFLRLFFRFVRAHRRVKLISYYQSAMLKPAFRLSSHPVSRSVLRRKVSSSKFLSGSPE